MCEQEASLLHNGYNHGDQTPSVFLCLFKNPWSAMSAAALC